MLAALLLTGLTFPLPVPGHTWTVYWAGGPGVDFTNLQSAIDAASPNDVLLVQGGQYATSTLDKGLRIVGQGNPVIVGTLRVENLPAQSLAVITGLRVNPSQFEPALAAANCLGTLVVDDLQGGRVSITNSLDVRLRNVVTPPGMPALHVASSRVELVESTFRGLDNTTAVCGGYPDGWNAAEVESSELHAARSSFRGGDGGDSYCPDPGGEGPAGIGGHGIRVTGTVSQLLVSGIPADLLVGGQGGHSFVWGPEPDGYGLFVQEGIARVSGSTIATLSAGATASILTAVPPDPTLRMLEVPAPGVNLTFRLVAPVGASAEMRIGAIPVVLPIGGPEEDVLVARAQRYAMGVVPAGGVLGFNFPIGASWPRGTTLFSQAFVTLPGGEVRRTHSIPIVVR